MRPERKADLNRLVGDLQKSTAFEATMIRDLVDLLLEEAKDLMIDADGNELLRVQGEARAYSKLHTKLTRVAAPIKVKEI